MSKELAELLGIEPEYEINIFGKNHNFESKEYLTAAFKANYPSMTDKEMNFFLDKAKKVYPDFEKPENNQILRDCIIKSGGSIGYDDEEVNVYFKYVDCTGIVKGDDTYNMGLVYGLKGVITQLQIPESGDFKIFEKLKSVCQLQNWSY